MVSAAASRRCLGDSTGFLNFSRGARSWRFGSCRFTVGLLGRWLVDDGFVGADDQGPQVLLAAGQGTERASLHEHVTQRRRLDPVGEHRQPEPGARIDR